MLKSRLVRLVRCANCSTVARRMPGRVRLSAKEGEHVHQGAEVLLDIDGARLHRSKLLLVFFYMCVGVW